MRYGRRNESDFAPNGPNVFFRAKIGCAALMAGLGLALIGVPARGQPKGQPELLPPPRLQGEPLVDPNLSKFVIPTPPKEEAPPPETETDVAKRVRLWREDPMFAAIADKEEVLGGKAFPEEEKAYDKIFRHVHEFSEEVLAQYSLKNPNGRGLSHADLVGDVRKDFLRELIRVEGRLVRIRPMKPTDGLANQFETLYEGWILNNNNPDYPICVVFSELPAGVAPGDSLSYQAQVDGYYFKLRKYKSKEKIPAKEPGKKDQYVERIAPLLLARTIGIIEPSTDSWGLGSFFIPVVVVMVLVFGAIVFGLMWWFRREDRQVQKMTGQALGKKNPFEEEPPPGELGFGFNRLNPPTSPN